MRILFIHTSSPGFLFPGMGLAKKLAVRGHEIAFTSDPKWRSFIEGEGFQFLNSDDDDHYAFQVSSWHDPIKVGEQTKHIKTAAAAFCPHILVSNDFCFGAHICGELLQVPLVVLGFGAWLYPTLNSGHAMEKERQWRLNRFRHIYNKGRSYCGLSSVPIDREQPFILGDLYLLRTIAELELENKAFPTKVKLVGPCLWEPEAPGTANLNDFLGDTPRDMIVYAQIGQVFKKCELLYNLSLAFGRTDFKIVVDTGRMDEKTICCPPNVFTGTRIPMGRVLPKALMTISTGMTTAYLGSISHGLPNFVVSSGGSGTSEICDRVLRHGLGIVLPTENVTHTSLASALEFIAKHPKIAENCRAFGRYFKASNSFETAACAVENLIAPGEGCP